MNTLAIEGDIVIVPGLIAAVRLRDWFNDDRYPVWIVEVLPLMSTQWLRVYDPFTPEGVMRMDVTDNRAKAEAIVAEIRDAIEAVA